MLYTGYQLKEFIHIFKKLTVSLKHSNPSLHVAPFVVGVREVTMGILN